ncbi:MAG: 16S rRNA (cytidine(1402)-2'-O)-methyltransferase, partial [Kangiellaceae bacterium]|nr:16S rRNA (cytidine(1402)-2'-O)-methyltransferase [Kangiellaceae bacterium]
MNSEKGRLYVVATPIGNLSDISQRAIETLAEVDRILAEDTRRTQQLLTHLSIKGSLVSLHDHNERQRVEQVAEWLEQGNDLALVSDAGTPLISDPGYALVSQLRQREYSVITVPGPSAIIAALSIAGLPTDRFCFEGFLPTKSGARVKALEAIKFEPRTMVFYESSHRIIASMTDMVAVFGHDRLVAITRELTKRFETVLYGTAQSVLQQLCADSNQQKGEFVVIVGGNLQL